MKTRLSLLCMVVFLTAMNVTDAQLHHPNLGGSFAGGQGLATGGESAFRQVRGDVQAGVPGRFWFETNVADRGLGYTGSYLTIGGKRRLHEDFLDGRWLFEAQIHQSIDDDEGDFFSNIGIERVFTIPAAGTDVSISGWYDFNDQTNADFSNPFNQLGISGAIKTRRWDLMANGYFPIGDTDVSLGDPTGVIPFARNSILSGAAVEAAQTGFDVTMRLRPKQLAFANGTIDFGGYGYKSDLIDFFGGGRVRLGFQGLKGAIVSAEVNYDENFNTTGVFSVGWVFGSNGGVGGEYAGLARDLETTQRNDHIVRVTDDAALVVNPVTGLPYNVLHVNNQGGASGAGDGTFERPFLTLREAEAASVEGDAIFVDSGDGSARNYQDGIELKKDQLLLGDGGTYTLPDASNGSLFPLVTDGGTGPIIQNQGESEVVLLADNNRIAGVDIDGTRATYGINGEVVDSGTFEDVTVRNATQTGVRLFNVFGDWQFNDNNFSNNGRTGLLVDGSFNPSATFLLSNNMANNNLTGHGMHFRNIDANSIILNTNTTNGNVGNGLFFEDFINTNGNGLNILNHVADSNIGMGINILRGNGKLNIFNPNVSNNNGGGIHITDWTNVEGENTIISGFDGTLAVLDGNGAGSPNLLFELTQDGLLQNILVTEALVTNGGGIGIQGLANGADTIMNIDIRDNVTVSNQVSDGIFLQASNSAVVNANIGNPANAFPDVLVSGNAQGLNGNGIALIARGLDGQPAAEMNALVRNVRVQNDDGFTDLSVGGIIEELTNGVLIQAIDNGIVDVLVANSDIGAPANAVDELGNPLDLSVSSTGVTIDLDNDGTDRVNQVTLDNLNIVVGDNDSNNSNIDVGVAITTGTDTRSDIVIRNSTIVPNSLQTGLGRADNTVFGDNVGGTGISILADGEADVIGIGYLVGAGPFGFGQGFLARDAVSDGLDDNLTRISIENNVVRDFGRDGIDVETTGDAQLVLNITGNDIINNGPGFDNDNDNDNIFNEQPADLLSEVAPPAIGRLVFFDGINIDAFEDSTISTRILGNTFTDNFEQALSFNTYQRATINALVQNNLFIGNDRGAATGVMTPVTSVGQTRMDIIPVAFVGNADVEVVNNDEFFIRFFEKPVFTIIGGDDDGELVDPVTGMVIDDDGAPGVLIPGNTGTDIFGFPTPFGTADINVAFVNNGFQHGVTALDFAVAPGRLALAGEGTDSDLQGLGTLSVSAAFVNTVITNEELALIMAGFTP